MAENPKKGAAKRVSEEQRMHYIGFDVFPGKPKDLFKTDAEKKKYVDGVVAKRQSGETLRDHNTLMDKRVSGWERILLTVASVLIFAALFLPWYSAYKEVPIKAEPAAGEKVYVHEKIAQSENTAIVVTPHQDSLDLMAVAQIYRALPVPEGEKPVYHIYFYEAAPEAGKEFDSTGLWYASYVLDPGTGEEVLALKDSAAAWPTATMAEAPAEGMAAGAQSHAGETSNEEIITGHIATKRFNKVYSTMTGLGAFASLGSAGSYVFSSGFVLIISAILMLLNGVLCVALPVINLYGLFGIKGKSDDVALRAKKLLRLNWLPLILTFVVLVLAFFGASYGFDTTNTFASISDSYSIGVLFNTLSWGVFVSIAMSLVVAFKAIEI